ncbi:ricin-type beta-trefoil lectin domain protein [Streptomyces sp. NPDC056257]|uniref:ricin-type beta-trefoil lectin domain protein n=1 Tax=Streptomyces sp. NPDC056257 TaxID=3345765 RepID=UPI0035DEFFD3
MPVTLGNLNTPKAQWPLTGEKDGTTPSTAGNFPATAAGVTWPTGVIGGRSTSYAAFNGSSSVITTSGPVIDTRKSFTISTMAKADQAGGVVLSQDLNRNSSLLLYPDHKLNVWRFGLANTDADTGAWPYDQTDESNSTATLALGAWTRLTAVYDHTTGQMRLYVNGTLAGTGRHSAATSPAPVGPLTLGRFREAGAPTPSGFTGGISNPAVYPYAASVTATEAVSPINLSAAAGNCVDNDGNSPDDGNKIQIAGCNGTDAQKFQVRNDGTVRTHGKCLNATAAGTANATPVELRTCDSSAPSQQFLPRADGGIHNPASGRCLDLGGFNTTPGTRLWLYDCNSSPAQRWTIPTLGTAPLPIPSP